MFRGTNNILHNVFTFRLNVRKIFRKLLSVWQNIVMALNNVMKRGKKMFVFLIQLTCDIHSPIPTHVL